MKIDSYSVNRPLSGICRQYAVWANSGNTTWPLVYLQRPKWIVDDKVWEKITRAIRIDLPEGFEITAYEEAK